MPRVRIKAGLANVVLPNGNTYQGGDIVNLTQEEYDDIATTALNDEVIPVSNIDELHGTTLFHYAHLPVTLADITAAGDVVSFTPGFAGKVVAVRFLCEVIGAGAGATVSLNLEIGTTNLTGGVTVVNLAGTDTVGELTAGSAVTGANTFDADDVLTLEAATVTAFTAGEGVLEVLLQET